mmetsp:Transcript_26142/g.31726  ORF Transcript_26142/g.31726 Transcript_26142/m.31726 type:complete len:286 (-) Transcript_26142:258-1115(-)|eukprot:CAMPEP_0197849920 /NCGR_PEP_ID=MMETSP1438-20131217/13664_1 /TAXON_ID=1461541 /ORGANISM="Pterosperma sp., Strain CCMP1384" /LENGTH=285 /DNA_ID=CAMNT_0043462825 /DNA_START=326 /DNA_END=1183 /DNA_ORIENTATION=+
MDFTQAYQQFDGVVSTTVFNTLDKLGWGVDPISPATKDLPLVAKPTGLVAFLIAYSVFVGGGLLFGKPANPKERKPFFGEYYFVLAHNVFLTLLSIYMSGKIVYEAYQNKYSIWGTSYNPAETEMAKVIWVFYVSKIYEFLDTVIMILKGNFKQVSFLHVYHHFTISVIWWMITYHAPGGDAYFSAALNSFVHVWMYTYYCLAHVLPKDDKTRKKYLWWGKYLTMFQMFQFTCNFFQALYLINMPSPTYPPFLSQILVWYMVSLLALFGNFFISKHFSKPKVKKT